MGWGTEFTTDVYLNRLIFTSKEEVKDKIHELQKEIAHEESLLISYACASPKDIAGEEWKDSPIIHVNFLMDELLENYRELLYRKFQLDLYLSYLEDNNIEKIPAQE